MIDKKLERVEADSPERCQANGAYAQCPYKRQPNSPYCPRHNDHSQQTRLENEEKRTYRLGIWQNRVNRFADDDKIKSLREEIGILRMLCEETMLRCDTPEKLLLESPKISHLIDQLKDTVTACHKIEAASGLLVDKQIVLVLATSIVQKISARITDDEVLRQIGEDIEDIMKQPNLTTLIASQVPQADPEFEKVED